MTEIFCSATRTTFGRWQAWCPVGDTPSDSTWERTSLRCKLLLTLNRISLPGHNLAKRDTLTAFFYKPHIIHKCPLPLDLFGGCHHRADGRVPVQPWHGEQHHRNRRHTKTLSISALHSSKLMSFSRCQTFTWQGMSWFGKGKSGELRKEES